MQSHLLPHVVSGIETSSSQKNIPALFFLPGFPDEKESFDLIASKYRNSHKIIQCCFPGFDVKTKSLGGGQLPRKWGYDFDLLIEMTKNTIQENTCEGQEVYVVSHDWGAALTYMLIEKYPTLIKALVACDVGVSHPNELTLKMVAILITYQLYLGIAFIMSQLCSQLIADLMVYFFPWKFIGPAPYETKMPRHPREMHSWMCYPYFYMTIGRCVCVCLNCMRVFEVHVCLNCVCLNCMCVCLTESTLELGTFS
mmetsp:Transcript_34319/g.44279  ORF Transcript_34319/g.44279 Transcript_34319/m.44279 type:complete len:254 (-) Transcript_34319:41-802(-)